MVGHKGDMLRRAEVESEIHHQREILDDRQGKTHMAVARGTKADHQIGHDQYREKLVDALQKHQIERVGEFLTVGFQARHG